MQARNQAVPGPQPVLGVSTGSASPLPKDGVIFKTLSRVTGTYTSDEFNNPSARGVRLNTVISPTGAATGTVTVTAQIFDPIASTWRDVLGGLSGGAAINGTGAISGASTTVYPGLTGIADATVSGATSINQHLGPRWRAQAVVALDTLSFSVSGDYLL